MPRSRRDILFDEEFLQRLRRLHLLAKRLTVRETSGGRRSRRIGDGLEFADHRSYSPGDDIRFIDWPYYARMERLLLRLFHQRSDADVVVLLDTSASMAPAAYAAKFDYACRAAAAIAFVAMGGLERVILQPFAARLGPALHTGRNRARILEVLDYLAGLEPAGPTALAGCCDRLARGLDAPATVLLIADLADGRNQLPDALARLGARRCDVTVLHVYSPLDAAPDLAGPVLLRHAETGREMRLHVTPAVRDAYRRRWEAFQGDLAAIAARHAARYVPAPSDAPFERLILHALRRAGVLAG